MMRVLRILLGFLPLVSFIGAVRFPYNPHPQYRPKVSHEKTENHCPSYNTYYEGDKFVVILQKNKCEMIVDKVGVQDSISIEGKPNASIGAEKNYFPTLKFRNMSPICQYLAFEYRGMRVTVQTSKNCQLTFAVRTFKERSPNGLQPIHVARPVIENA